MRVMHILLFFCIVALTQWTECVFGETNLIDTNEKSTLRPVVERVFSRKKRWMLFPKGANLKFTLNVSKRLLAMYPKGFNFNFEAAIYYPMPSARIDLIPKRFRKPTTKAPAPKGPTPLYLVGIPGSLIKYRAKPATKPAKVQRIDQNISSLQWVSSPSASLSNTYYNKSQEWSKYSSPEYLKNYQWTPEKQQKYVNKYFDYNNKWSRWSSNTRTPQSVQNPSFNNQWNPRPRYSRDVADVDDLFSSIDDYHHKEYEPIYFEDLEPFEDSPHYHSYRGRRELFHHFEGFSKILGIDMKSCILRAVCDSKRFLLPPGYSMIQDILRVVFTFPTINGLKDDYTRIMEADYETCDAHVHNKCPLSILDWLLNSKKSL
ncbi:hypothetical protein CVS40_7247 [Lucilia cuprina]|nr:hypothetical protein CVS40_7247 [Lucilia cuprina]